MRAAAARLDARFGLDALWLFGSQASERATAHSDVDLAALFERAPDRLALGDAQDELAALLGCDVDLVDLERASPALAYQAVEHGRLVADPHPRRRHRFVAALIPIYADLMIVRRPIERAILKRTTSGRA